MAFNDKITDAVSEKNISSLSPAELCELAARLCSLVEEESGAEGYRGGVYPENISIDAEGRLALGPATAGDWTEKELDFIAPELYWHGRKGPAADVYSVGMLLYWAVSGDKLPFDGDDKARLRRMGGEEFPAPSQAGRRLGEIIHKATAFDHAGRYQSMDELCRMLEGCEQNIYVESGSGAGEIFKKEEHELSEMERMMLGIIEGGRSAESEKPGDMEAGTKAETEAPEESAEVPIENAVEEAAEETAPSPTAEAEESAHDEVNAEMTAEEEEAAAEPAMTEESAHEPVMEETQAGETLPNAEAAESKAESPENPAEEEDEAVPLTAAEEERPLQEEPALGEKLPEPEIQAPAREPIPILTVEENPELEPVMVRIPITPAVQYSKSMERERKIAEEVKKRRKRPMMFTLVCCALLVVVAIIANGVKRDINERPGATAAPAPVTAKPRVSTGPVRLPESGVSFPEETAAPSPTPSAKPAREAKYEVIIEDISWTDARDMCLEKGGHLVVISDLAEYDAVVKLASESGVQRLWVGCYRSQGQLQWVTGEQADYMPWADGEPSFTDSSDGAPEDYVMIWENGGWFFNDSRNDPAREFPELYSGTIGYICEYED